MKQFSLAAVSTLLSFGVVSSVQAQVTPEDVWQGWQKASATYGQALVADTVARQGDTLVVSGMKISMDQDGAKVSGSLDEVRFRDLGDGTVEVTMSETYPLTMTMPAEDGATEELKMLITQPGVKMIAGGSATETDYTLSAPTMNLAIQAARNGEQLADINATFTAVNGTYNIDTVGEKSLLDSDLAVDSLAFTASGIGDGSPFDMTGNLVGLKLATAGNFPVVAAMENISQALRDGFSTDFTLSYGAGNFLVNGTDGEGNQTKVVATNETGDLTFKFGDGAIAYAAGGTGVSIALSGGNIPFPELKINYKEAGFELAMPIIKTEKPADFSFVTRIVDLTLSDEIWGMFDPTAVIPRDPSTLILETKGTTTMTLDIMDPVATAAAGTEVPFEINSLDLTNLVVKGTGIELTGSGGVVFDNTDLVTFDGVPAPTGTVEMVLKGGNGLIDKLVAIGAVPEQDALGLRMAMAMFGKPGEGEDVLNSKVEFKDKGLFMNGTRLK